MRRRNSTHCVGSRYPYQQPSRQPCSCPLRDNYSRTFGLRYCYRRHWRGVVWIALATLFGCCVVTDTSSVLLPASSPPAATRDSEGGLTGARLSRSSLLPRPSSSSSDVDTDNIGDTELFIKDYDSDADDSNRRSWNATTTRTSDELSTNTARRRLTRTRRMLNSGILCCCL